VGTDQAEVLAKEVDEVLPGLDLGLVAVVVDHDRYLPAVAH
jgi:hypothetical protein